MTEAPIDMNGKGTGWKVAFWLMGFLQVLSVAILTFLVGSLERLGEKIETVNYRVSVVSDRVSRVEGHIYWGTGRHQNNTP